MVINIYKHFSIEILQLPVVGMGTGVGGWGSEEARRHHRPSHQGSSAEGEPAREGLSHQPALGKKGSLVP